MCLTCGCTDSRPFEALETSAATDSMDFDDAERNLVDGRGRRTTNRLQHRRDSLAGDHDRVGKLVATVQIPGGDREGP